MALFIHIDILIISHEFANHDIFFVYNGFSLIHIDILSIQMCKLMFYSILQTVKVEDFVKGLQKTKKFDDMLYIFQDERFTSRVR